MVVKAKTSIYVDRDLWSRFKEYASKNSLEASRMLEELIEDALIEGELDRAFWMGENYEIDFEPIEPRGGLASEFIRVMRNERSDSLLR